MRNGNWTGALTLFLLATSPALAQEPRRPAVERFVELVQSGHDLKGSEFGDALSPADAARLLTVARCRPGEPRYSEGGSSVVILWDCSGEAGAGSVGTMLALDQDGIESIFVMSAVIVPIKGQ